MRKKTQISQEIKLIPNGKIVIEALDGKDHIFNAKKTFSAMTDARFIQWGLNEWGPATAEQEVVVGKLVKKATFFQIFGGVSLELEKLALTQHQVINFCKKHPEMLVQKRFGTFFLTKIKDEFFVVDVCSDRDGLMIFCHRLGADVAWSTGRRVVLPVV